METIVKFENILAAREERYQKMQFLKTGYKTVITVKTNVPGIIKNLKLSYTLTKLFKNLIPKMYIAKLLFFDTLDGPYYLIGSNYDADGIKNALMSIEDEHFLGRFIDLDVYDGKKTLSRQVPRNCYLCDNVAFNCIREKRHSIEELISFVENKTLLYFEQEVSRIIDDSILLELNLHPKFGLVTPNTKGSHKDMNYKLMTRAKNTILPYLVQMFTVGWKSKLNDVFLKIRIIGLEAEKEMFKVTNNINAYKGLIFNLGILVSAYGYVFRNHHDIENIYDVVKSMSVDILKDFDTSNKTFGYFAYEQYNILGARGEVHKGIPNVKKALSYLKSFSQESRTRTLMYLISVTEDTVLLKRSKDIDHYLEIKKMFKDNLNGSPEDIINLDKYCIKNNLSFGGSADLLILTIFLKKIGLN
ncbi:MAG: triphosphoribosyl-dephospho-CoA synthase [Tenericutes bacterium]|nr:triphosphoribosyl-dephospho-CoA synthase [Mycoplasmatota bacterium]